MEPFAIIGSIVVWVICGIAAGTIAKDKGHSGLWFFIGFLLGVFGVIIALCLSDKRKETPNGSNNKKNIKETWKCPSCGKKNYLDALFCPECGEKYLSEYIVKKENPWICGNCNCLNDSNNKFCKKCGTDKATAIAKTDEKKTMKAYIEEHGEECQMCGKKALELYNVKIVDEMGIRYRKVCDACFHEYNCVVIPDKEQKK